MCFENIFSKGMIVEIRNISHDLSIVAIPSEVEEILL